MTIIDEHRGRFNTRVMVIVCVTECRIEAKKQEGRWQIRESCRVPRTQQVHDGWVLIGLRGGWSEGFWGGGRVEKVHLAPWLLSAT